MAELKTINLPAYDDLDRILLRAAEIIANRSPYDTGNLRINAITAEWVDVEHTALRIYIDKGAILRRTGGFDYADWLNESPDSPHYGWWDRACEDAVNYLRSVLS